MKAIFAVLVVLAWVDAAGAETSDMKRLDQIIDRYHACFYASARSQFIAKIDSEANMVAERAFQACATEEETFANFLALHGTMPDMVRALVLQHRNSLKHKITG